MLRSLIFLCLVLFTISPAGAAGSPGPLVNAGWLKSKLDNANAGLAILDIRPITREGNPFATGHIPGAVHAPYIGQWRKEVGGVVGMLPPVHEISAYIASLGIDNEDLVVIVPFGKNSSDFGSATRIYWTFKVLGHDRVTILDGGYEAWARAGGQLSPLAAIPVAGNFSAQFRPELLATADQVQAAMADGAGIVDARPRVFFTGKTKSPAVRKAGTIPGASNLEQQKLYDAPNASFVSRQRINELAAQSGVDAGSDSITFCNTGHWASIAWFALSEIAGRKNISMYDGSMAEWTLDDKRPVQ